MITAAPIEVPFQKRCNDCLMVLTKPWVVRILLDCIPANKNKTFYTKSIEKNHIDF